MKRIMVSLAALTTWGLLTAVPEAARAQVSVDVHLSWHWDDGQWRQDRLAYDRGGWIPAPRAPAPPPRYYRAPAPPPRYRAPAIRIPPGHLPPPGTCKLWYVGRPPGHQPPPQPCWQLFRSYNGPGVVIVEGPRYADPHPGRGRGKAKGHGRGRGRGG